MCTQSTELWRPCPGFEDIYEVSDHGRIRRLVDAVKVTNFPVRHKAGHILTPGRNRDGYAQVKLNRPGRPVQMARVHRLVLIAFRGLDPDRPEADHLDNDRYHACLSNLEWVTKVENRRRRELRRV